MQVCSGFKGPLSLFKGVEYIKMSGLRVLGLVEFLKGYTTNVCMCVYIYIHVVSKAFKIYRGQGILRF